MDPSNVKNNFFFLNPKEKKLLTALIAEFIPTPSKSSEIRIINKIDKKLIQAHTGIYYNGDPWKGIFYKEGLKTLSAQLNKQPLAEIIKKSNDDFLQRFLAAIRQDVLAIYYYQPLTWDMINLPKKIQSI